MRTSENRGSQEEEEGMIDISSVWPRAESIHRPLFFARELARYCPLKFLRDENRSCSDTNNAKSEMIRRDWRDDYSCRYHDTTECTVYGILRMEPHAITTSTEFVSFDACLHADGATFARLQWRKRNELFLEWCGRLFGEARKRNFIPKFQRYYFPDKSFSRCQWNRGQCTTGYYVS